MISSDNSIRELFALQNSIYEVPNYQRYFVWEKNEIKSFLKDVFYCYEQNNSGNRYDHFLGQMVFRLIMEDRSGRQHLEIVDGQQRLTTFELTVAAAYRLILSAITSMNAEEKQYATGILKEIRNDYIISTPHSGSVCRKIRLSEKDNPLLVSILSVAEDIRECNQFSANEFESQKRIVAAFEIIYDQLNRYFSNQEISTYAQTMKAFLKTISDHFSVVVIKSTSVGYSYALFQIVNDRGVSLTPAELLKARTMELLFSNNSLFGECESIWNEILNDPGKDTTKYLSWYYTSKMFKAHSSGKMHEAYEESIFHTYGKRQLNEDEQTALAQSIRDLYENIKRCRELANGRLPIDGINNQVNNVFYALVIGLKNESVIPLFLNILNIENINKKQRLANELTLLLSKFFFVAKTIAGIHAGSITQVYKEIAKSIACNNSPNRPFEEICRSKIEQKQCMVSFQAQISREIYSNQSSNITKFLLYFLELFYCTTTRYSVEDILSRDTATVLFYENTTTEHIAAKSGYGRDSIDIDSSERNKLGNLTIIGDNVNNNLGDKPFEEKREAYSHSPFAMTREVGSYDTWTFASFAQRQNRLIEKALQIFQI